MQDPITNWHVITSEYPPQIGGVSDYAKLIATELKTANDEVHVWCGLPGTLEKDSEEKQARNSDGVLVHEEFGRFAPADLKHVGLKLDQFPEPRRLLVQWVPQGYGYRSMNLPFCLWLWHRAKRKRDRIEVMAHEPFLAFGEGSRKQDLAAAVHRLMVVILLKAASRVWVSIPDWETRLRPFVFGPNKPFGWLPVPSTVPVIVDPGGTSQIRDQYSMRGGSLVGHFGAYDRYMVELMLKVLPSLLQSRENLAVILLGRGGRELLEKLSESHPETQKRIHATGSLTAENISRHLAACDVLLQPYQDGVSGRRTSVMAGISHGIPVVTTTGKATEACWSLSQAVKLTKTGDVDAMVGAVGAVLDDDAEKSRLGEAGRTLYHELFDVKRTIATLRAAAEPEVA